jgi:hypothetical protein
MRNAAILIFVFLLPNMFSCSTETIVCHENGMFMSGVGFTMTDLGGAILYRYKKDNIFDSLVDSAQVNFAVPHSDTSVLTRSITADYDYKLLLPATNAIYNITAITASGSKTQTIHEGLFDQKAYACSLRLASYSINATIYTSTPNDNAINGDTIFVRK